MYEKDVRALINKQLLVYELAFTSFSSSKIAYRKSETLKA